MCAVTPSAPKEGDDEVAVNISINHSISVDIVDCCLELHRCGIKANKDLENVTVNNQTVSVIQLEGVTEETEVRGVEEVLCKTLCKMGIWSAG